MSSGSQSASQVLDRILKLWISLWSLVLQDRRFYESVCATLQRLVFEKTGWPEYKNWPVICQLGTTEPLMQKIIQDLDTSELTERNARIIAAFGDCFSHTEVSGIPLSVVINRIAERRQQDPEISPESTFGQQLDNVKSGVHLFMHDKCYIDEFGFPLTFLYDQNSNTDLQDVETDGFKDVPRFWCPDGILSENVNTWTTLWFQGKLHVIIEIDTDIGRITIVPAEYIALDL